MRTESAELDPERPEAPGLASAPHPTLVETAITWVQLAGVTAVVNVVVHAIAVAAGAGMSVDLGMFDQAIGPSAVVVATLGTLLISTFAWGLVAHRVPAFAELWVPIGWGVGLVSLGGILGASGVATGIALATMHLLTTAVAAHLIPRRLPR